jgi:hypothetical protein
MHNAARHEPATDPLSVRPLRRLVPGPSECWVRRAGDESRAPTPATDSTLGDNPPFGKKSSVIVVNAEGCSQPGIDKIHLRFPYHATTLRLPMHLQTWRRQHGADLIAQVAPLDDIGVWQASAWITSAPAHVVLTPRRLDLLVAAQVAADHLVRTRFGHTCDVRACGRWSPEFD